MKWYPKIKVGFGEWVGDNLNPAISPEMASHRHYLTICWGKSEKLTGGEKFYN